MLLLGVVSRVGHLVDRTTRVGCRGGRAHRRHPGHVGAVGASAGGGRPHHGLTYLAWGGDDGRAHHFSPWVYLPVADVLYSRGIHAVGREPCACGRVHVTQGESTTGWAQLVLSIILEGCH